MDIRRRKSQRKPININQMPKRNMPIKNITKDKIQTYKVILVGKTGVGKTSIIQRFTNNEFIEGYKTTIGVEFNSKVITDEKQNKIKLNIWDTAGQEQYQSLVSSFYRNSDVIIMVYSIADKSSFEDCDRWQQEVDNVYQNNSIRVLVGTQNDRREERQVGTDEGNEYAQKNGYNLFFETSALQGDNIDHFFKACVKALNLRRQYFDNLQKPDQNQASFMLSNDDSRTISLKSWSKRNSRPAPYLTCCYN